MTKKSDLIKELQWLEESIVHSVQNPNDPDLLFWAHCHVPDTIERVREALQPWHWVLLWKIKGFWRGLFSTPDNQIPF